MWRLPEFALVDRQRVEFRGQVLIHSDKLLWLEGIL